MPFYDREEKIIDILFNHDTLRTTELAKQLYISLPTLRRDLIKLEQKGIIRRSYGTVSLKTNSADEKIPFILRRQEHNIEKKQYCAKGISTHNSRIVQLAIIDTLYFYIVLNRSSQSLESIKETERALLSKKY